MSAVDGAIFCGTQSGPSYRSTDGGISWTDIGLSAARGFTAHNDTLYAVRWSGTPVSYSADGGDTWASTGTISGANGNWPIISHGGMLFIGAQSGGVFRTPSSTAPWSSVSNGMTNTETYAFTSFGDTLFAGTAGGAFRSTDLGNTWVASGFTDTLLYALHTIGTNLFAGLGNGGVYLSTDGGVSWVEMNNGLGSQQVVRLTSDAQYLYAGTLGGGAFRYGLTNLPTTVPNVPLNDLSLGHVWPNPCVDATTIAINMKIGGRIYATLHDAMGKQMKVISTSFLPAGPSTLRIDTEDLGSGSYFIRIGTGRGSDSEHFVVIK